MHALQILLLIYAISHTTTSDTHCQLSTASVGLFAIRYLRQFKICVSTVVIFSHVCLATILVFTVLLPLVRLRLTPIV